MLINVHIIYVFGAPYTTIRTIEDEQGWKRLKDTTSSE